MRELLVVVVVFCFVLSLPAEAPSRLGVVSDVVFGVAGTDFAIYMVGKR